jgi:glutamate dehydrogenase/leucine dehydrogenase
VQNLQNVRWTRRKVDDELRERLTRAFGIIHRRSLHDSVSLRDAAHRVAVERVAAALRLRGLDLF